MNNEICWCTHPKERHTFVEKYFDYSTTEGLSCMHCSCKEFYAREEKLGELVEECPKDDLFPGKSETYWMINDRGEIQDLTWKNDKFDISYRDFLGVYRDWEEAEAVRDKVREFIRNLNKK